MNRASAQSTIAKKGLGAMGFYALTLAMVMDLHVYSVFATSGLSLVFFLVAGGILWFLPTALAAAELATVEDWETGGIYVWVKNTLGERLGFAAVFFQWFQVTVGFIAMLYFILAAIASVTGFTALNTNLVLQCFAVIAFFWIITFIQFRGSRITEKFGNVGGIVGILLPTLILFALAAAFLLSGAQSQTPLTTQALLPNFGSLGTLVVFISFILSYMGIEASASYANDLDNPKRTYPTVMIMMVVSAVILNAIGGMSVALTVPLKNLSLSSGITQALTVLFANIGIHAQFAAGIVTLMIAIGVTAEVAGWVVGPARGIYMAAQQGLLPPLLRKVNQYDVPVVLLIIQGIVVTIWACVLTIGGGGNNLSFLIAISLTVVIYIAAYLLLYAAYFVLIFKHKDLKRRYHLPGGIVGKTLIAGIGTLASLFALGITFVPPSTLQSGESATYLIILTAGFLVTLTLPFLIYARRNKAKHKTIVMPSRITLAEARKRRFVLPRFRGMHHIRPAPEDYLPFSQYRKARRLHQEEVEKAEAEKQAEYVQ